MSLILRGSDKYRKDTNRLVGQKWGKSLELLDVFISLSEDIGADFTDDIIKAEDNSSRFIVLSRSHARSLVVSKEILTLLRNGFAGGAHARWRTLHEIAVETNIINKNDNQLAKKFRFSENCRDLARYGGRSKQTITNEVKVNALE